MTRAVLVIVCAIVLNVQANAATVPGDDFNANASTAASVLQSWYNPQGLWNDTHWWNAANCIEALQDVITAENGGRHLSVFDRTYSQHHAGGFLNEFYDDEGWWALAWIRAFDLTGDARYLGLAKSIFADMTQGWDSHCDGGIWWKKDRQYKNAIANELFLLVAIRLHQRTPDDGGPGSYLDWAQREWNWFRNSGMINGDHLINDGLTRRCENNGRPTWSYNQGVIIGGLTELYKTTGDTNALARATAIADAAIATLVYSNGVLREICEPDECGGPDVAQFKGIFIRYLADLYDVTRQPAYYDFIRRNARSIWTHNRDSSNRFGMKWIGPVDTVDPARQSSAMMPITAMAEPVTTNLAFAKGAGNPAFNHDVGGASGVHAWICSPENTTRSGWMLSGPYLASLAQGSHTVQFRLTVNKTSRSRDKLVRLDVRDHQSGSVLAVRDVVWNEFVAADSPIEFALRFTNSHPGGQLEFRAYWNFFTNAPALTISDVWLGEQRAWVAANMQHEAGQLDGKNAWCADPIRNQSSGYLAKTAVTGLARGRHRAVFELKIDNFNRDSSVVGAIEVVESGTGNILASRELRRTDFQNVLYQTFELEFIATSGTNVELRTRWIHASSAPRLTQRSAILSTFRGSATDE